MPAVSLLPAIRPLSAKRGCTKACARQWMRVGSWVMGNKEARDLMREHRSVELERQPRHKRQP